MQNSNSDQTDLLENALDAIVGIDEENRVIFWNKNAEIIFGWEKSQIQGKDMTDLIIPQAYRNGHRMGLRRFIATGIPKIQNRRIEIPGLRKNGEEFPMELTVSSFKSEDGYRFYSFMRDITEQKQAEKKLRESEDELRTLANSIPQLAWMAHPDGHIFWYNERWYQYTGTRAEDMEGWGWSAVHDPKVLPEVIERWKESIQTGNPFDMVVPLRSRSGNFRSFLTRILPLRSSSGEIIRWFGTNTDIEDSVIVQKQAQEDKERLRFALASANMGAWSIDLKTGIATLSDELVKIFGLDGTEKTPQEIISNAIHPDDRGNATKDLSESISRKVPYQNEYRILKADGSVRWISSQGQTKFAEDGTPLTLAGVVTDITEKKLKESELRLAKEEAERANQLKSAFLANMSHEIRTPLGAMMGFADLLRDLNLSETERSNYTDILARNGEQLSVIINDILDLSKVEAGHLNLEYTDSRPVHIAAEVVSLLRVKAKEKDLALELNFDSSTPEHIVSDPTRIRQVLLNLVSNAIKFTQFGSVKIHVYGCTGTHGRPSICFDITDTGMGIASHLQEKIFEVFVQADGSMTRRFGGTGLGLPLSKKLALALGGDVTVVSSKENQGSTFLFQVEDQPHLRSAGGGTSRAEKFSEIELTQDTLRGKSVLVVDDAPDNQQLIWRYLTKHGAVVESAENGLLGFRKAMSGKHDIILMDIQMPEMDGYTATLKLRQAGYRKPILALTAHAMDDVRKKCLNVGCSDHLTKPIDAKQLIRAVLRYTGE